MLEHLDEFEDGVAARATVLAAIERQTVQVVAGRGAGRVEEVERVESLVAAAPERAFRFGADGSAALSVGGRRYQAGRFEVLPLCELRARALAGRRWGGEGRRRLWVLDGSAPITDIGALQACAAPGTLFQVASQFNCLEAPGAYVVPVHRYLADPTQGPRASISAFPGTLLRHYAAPTATGGRFVQTQDGPQLELLGAACTPGVATVQNGYLRSETIEDPQAFARALDERFEQLAVGVHDGVEVVLGANWAGEVPGAPHRTIAQVFTSTVAGGMYGAIGEDSAGEHICRQLQRLAYLGTLLAAAALGKRRVVLTLIGGGVFANPVRLIWDSILWAADQLEPWLHDDLSIVVNGRELGEEVPRAELVAATYARGGGVVSLPRSGAASIVV